METSATEKEGLQAERRIQTAENRDSWIWREWFDVAPGSEAVDLEDLAGEIGSGAGKEMWLSRAELEGG